MARTATAQGKTFTFSDDTTPEQMGVAIDEFFSGAANDSEPVEPEQPELQPTSDLGFAANPTGIQQGIQSQEQLDTGTGRLEALGTVASGAIAEPVAGLAGIAQSINPFADEGAGGRAVDSVRESLTYDPSTPEGRESLNTVAKTLKPITEILQKAEQVSGEAGFDIAGPIGGAIATALPTAMLELFGLAGAKGVAKAGGKIDNIAKAVPDQAAQNVLDAGKQFDVPVLTTDVAPPTTYLGRFSQGLSEKLGPLGSGTARASQQAAREAAVKGFADSMDIDLDTPFANDLIKSLNEQTARELQAAGKIRSEAVEVLDRAGVVPMEQTKRAVIREVAKQKRLGAKGDAGIVQNLENTLDALEGGDFSLVKDIRTELISDLSAIRRSEDTRGAASVQAVKSAMDADMLSFAKDTDRLAASKWVKSNRQFSDAYTRTKDTELKRIIKAGEATPERIIPLLRGGKPSELKRLKKSIGEDGQKAARGAIIQDALKDSKFFEIDANPNPDAFATALNRPNRRQAINVFFEGAAKKEIEGLTRLLNSTRRAQQGSAVIKTGEQLVPVATGGAIGAALYADAVTGLSATVVASALAKAYESTRFRNLLLKLRNTQAGSKRETRLLELASTFAVPELQAAKTEQEGQ